MTDAWIVITGGRDYKDKKTVFKVLNVLNPQKIYVGDCPTGVDKFVLEWQTNNMRTALLQFKADWDEHGRAAGPIRNKEMILAAKQDNFDFVIAFPGGKGTVDCVKHAKNAGFVVLRVE